MGKFLVGPAFLVDEGLPHRLGRHSRVQKRRLKLWVRLAFRIRQGPDVGFQLRRFRFRLVISPSGEIALASDPSSQFVQPQRHGMVRPPEHALRFPDAPVQVVQGHLGLERPALAPVNFRAASLNDAITSSVRTFIILSLGPALEPETTRKGVEQKKRIMPRLFSGDSLTRRAARGAEVGGCFLCRLRHRLRSRVSVVAVAVVARAVGVTWARRDLAPGRGRLRRRRGGELERAP